ncbi:hypothetical protein SNEBB_008661 [Seison nebaliae]|nr:hypothetical protein SNEBB_008661 [Seison nebaliae]
MISKSIVSIPRRFIQRRSDELLKNKRLINDEMASERSEKISNKFKNSHHTYQVYSWGNGECGALGNLNLLRPKFKYQLPITKVTFPLRLKWADRIRHEKYLNSPYRHKRISMISAGSGFSILTDKRNIFGCGVNTYGQLDKNEKLEIVIQPIQLNKLIDLNENLQIISLSSGRAHSVIVYNDGSVYSWGQNNYHQVSSREEEIIEFRRLIEVEAMVNVNEKIIKTVCSFDTTFLLTNMGRVISFGLNTDGQCGINRTDSIIRRPVFIEINEIFCDICTKADTILALTSDKKSIYGWGNTEYEQLKSNEAQLFRPINLNETVLRSIPSERHSFVSMATSGSSCCVVDKTGQIWIWGYGALGLGPNNLGPLPLACPISRNFFDLFKTKKTQNKIIELVSGLYSFGAITERGDAYVWGANRQSCLGIGKMDTQYYPTKLMIPAKIELLHFGYEHSFAITKSFN